MDNLIKISNEKLEGFVSEDEILSLNDGLKAAENELNSGSGAGKDFLGWRDLPDEIQENEINEILATSGELISMSDVIVCIGIGGSYLGAKAAIEFVLPQFVSKKIVFAGNSISPSYHKSLLDSVKGKDFSIIVISKSGTTTEPAIAFRLLRDEMKRQYTSSEIKKRIVCVTDPGKGALRQLSDNEGLKSFVIPSNVGGRFSVLTPVGLLPIASAGVDIKGMIRGAAIMKENLSLGDVQDNISLRYVAIRNLLLSKGKVIEVLSGFDPCLSFVAEWWKQLFGESEGKDGKGIFPASCVFTTDLHSMGQLIQDGNRNLFETFIKIKDEEMDLCIPSDENNLDNLNYLADKKVSYVNDKAHEATAEAHFEGGVPNITLEIQSKSAESLGALFYFFEKSVALSGYFLGVNPFNQPGVESYKTKMFNLLGKPGS